LDDGDVQEASALAIQAASLGGRSAGNNLRNPSGGEVRIPASILVDARLVSIRPDKNSAHRVFDMTGLFDAVQVAREKGCDVV
jgi:hypothetical protein